jgi:two-component system, NarL family, invasion response regulator UvrY
MTGTSIPPRSAKCRILVADDHALVRAGIRKVFALDDRLEVVGEAATAGEVLAWLAGREVDLVLLDLAMPGCSGTDLIARVVATYPDLPILMLTMNADRQVARRALEAGVRGFLSKSSAPDELLRAIHRVAGGNVYIDPSLEGDSTGPATVPVPDGPLMQLSSRELQVLFGLVGGKPLVDIAAEMRIATNTVSTYKARLMEKLGQTSLSELVRYAIRHGLAN